jgi:hypothetical protein
MHHLQLRAWLLALAGRNGMPEEGPTSKAAPGCTPQAPLLACDIGQSALKTLEQYLLYSPLLWTARPFVFLSSPAASCATLWMYLTSAQCGYLEKINELRFCAITVGRERPARLRVRSSLTAKQVTSALPPCLTSTARRGSFFRFTPIHPAYIFASTSHFSTILS